MKIHPIQHIKERLEIIQAVLESHYDGDDGGLLSSRLTEVSAYMAEAGKLKSDANYWLNEKLLSESINAIKNIMPEYTSASVQNTIVKSLAKEERHLVEFADRVNASCTHQIDAMRSQLSYLKSITNF